MTREIDRELLVAWMNYLNEAPPSLGMEYHIDAFLASRAPAPPEYVRFFPCPFCGQEVSHPEDGNKPLPPAPQATAQRYWRVDPRRGGEFRAYVVNARGEAIQSLGAEWRSHAEAEADGRASGLPEWTGRRP